MPKSLGKRLDDQSIAVKKTVEEQSKEGLRLYADLAWKDCISDISYQSLEWIDWEIYSYDEVLYVTAQSATSGNYPGYHIFMSIDGETYAHIKYIQPAALSWVSGGLKLAAHNEHIVIEYQNSTSVRHRTVSHDYGATWTDTYNIGYMPEDLIYANGYFVSHQKGAANFYCSSDNGATWAQKTPSFGRKIGNIAVLGDTFLFTDAGSTTSSGLRYSNNYYTTTDLTTYTQNYFPINTINQVAVAYGNNKYVWIIGQYAHSTKYIYTSNSLFHANPGTTDWTASTTTPNFNAYNAACVFKPLFLDSRFLIGYNNAESVSSATKYYAYTAYSIDGSTWITITKDEIDGGNIARNSCLVKLHHRAWFTWGAIGIFNRSILNILQGDISQIEGIAESIETRLKHVQTKLTAGPNVAIAQDGTISATDTTYTAGRGITIINNQIASTVEGGGGSGNLTFAKTLTIDEDNIVHTFDVTGGTYPNLSAYKGLSSKTFSDGKTNIYAPQTVYQSNTGEDNWTEIAIRSGSAGFASSCEFNGITYFLEYPTGDDSSFSREVKVCSVVDSTTFSSPVTIYTATTSSEKSYIGSICIRAFSDRMVAIVHTDLYVNKIFTSTNGTTWTNTATLTDSNSGRSIEDIGKVGSYYFTKRYQPKYVTDTAGDFISTDLTNWTSLVVDGYVAAVSGEICGGAIITTAATTSKHKFTTDFTTFSTCNLPDTIYLVSTNIGPLGSKAIALAGNMTGPTSYAYITENGTAWEQGGNWAAAFSKYTNPRITTFGDENVVFETGGVWCHEISFRHDVTEGSSTVYYNTIAVLQTIDGFNWSASVRDLSSSSIEYEFTDGSGYVVANNSPYAIFAKKTYSGDTMQKIDLNISQISSVIDAGHMRIDQNDVTDAVATTVASKLPAADGVTIIDALGALTATGFNSVKLVAETTTAPLMTATNNTLTNDSEGTWHVQEISVAMFND